MNPYKYSEEFPYHISVGAVLFNDHQNIACQIFAPETIEKMMGVPREMRTLMRETIEPDETIIQALHRGLKEEYGISGTMLGYLGSLQGKIAKTKLDFLKTTLYFLVKLNPGEELLIENTDGGIPFGIEWREPDELINLMNTQSEGLEREDLNEAAIIQRAKPYLAKYE